MRPKDRFEVFKRDGFTCQYCGRKTPDVVLEVDHIIPKAEGGGSEFANLLTACWDCNRGKGARLLDDRAPVPDLAAQAELIHEREAQLRVYNAVKRAERDREKADFDTAHDHWFDVWHTTSLPTYHVPWKSSLKHFVNRLGVEEVMEAMDITGARFDYVNSNAVRYFAGVCKRKIAEREGRVRTCTVCAGFIVLTPEQALRGDCDWSHTSCLEPS